MKISLGEKEFKLKWNHFLGNDTSDFILSARNTNFLGLTNVLNIPKDDMPKAVSFVRILQGDVTVAYGAAFCSSKDVFSRGYGRQLAMKRALDSMSFLNNEERRKLWLSYLERDKNAAIALLEVTAGEMVGSRVRVVFEEDANKSVDQADGNSGPAGGC
jgi:hypothetical protein